MGIHVRATQPGKNKGQVVGFDGMQRRREGDVFMLEDRTWKDRDGKEHVVTARQQFSKNWMKEVTKKQNEEDEDDAPSTKKQLAGKGARVSDQSKI